ncbi:MAG: AraC family ligand binding domain-containing protein [Chloroflexota bacterium]|nr:AraC family ligand binding domain-containing protein [Chloroflexota bacterium]
MLNEPRFPQGVEVERWKGFIKPHRVGLELKMIAEGLSPFCWSNGPGYRYSPHRHSRTQILYVLEGSITFTLPDSQAEVELRIGDRLLLPANVLHSAVVGSQGVTCLDAER